MRDVFKHFYEPTEDEFKQIWEHCIFTFDTNVLLHVYRYTPETRNLLFSILRKLSDRIWLTYQAGQEYHENRLDVITAQRKAYSILVDTVASTISSLKTNIDKEYKKHSFIDVNAISGKLLTAVDDIKSEVLKAESQHPDLHAEDPLRDELSEIFANKVGAAYDRNIYQSKLKDAEARLSKLLPPGYKDAKKEGNQKYGDVILWFQILDKARLEKNRSSLLRMTLKRIGICDMKAALLAHALNWSRKCSMRRAYGYISIAQTNS